MTASVRSMAASGDTSANTQLAHRICNLRKWAKMPEVAV